MISLIQPVRREELARLKIAAEASSQSLEAHVKDVRDRVKDLRTNSLGDVVKQYPLTAVGVAAGGGFLAYYLVKTGGFSLVTLSAMQSVAMQVISTLKS